MRVYLVAAPDDLRAAQRRSCLVACGAYGVGPEGRLTRQRLGPPRGGVMVLDDRDCGPIRAPAALCREVLTECASRGFCGVLADFERPTSPDRIQFLQRLAQLLTQSGRQLFVPESYGGDVPRAAVVLSTALSGGCLRQRLEEARQRFGPRLALDLQRLRMRFPLPCPTGEGCPLTGAELQALMAEQPTAVFFSRDLCAKYFTCHWEGNARFVLFDDEETLREKLRLGRELGIATGFLLYPEAADLSDEFFPDG